MSQEVVSLQVGDSQQAVSDFLKKEGKPQEKTRQKYLEKLKGFKEYYDTNKLQDKKLFKEDGNAIGKLSDAHKQIISDAFLLYEKEVREITIVKKIILAERLDAENSILKEIKGINKMTSK